MQLLNKYLALLLPLVLAISCSRQAAIDTSLAWPPPPLEPRIVFVKSIYGSQSLPRSFWGKVKDFLLGKSPDMSITKPYGVAFDEISRLYVADTARKGIMVLNLDSGKIDFFNSLGPYGKLGEPVNVILDNDGNIYVADTKLSKIAVFDKTLKFSHFIGSPEVLQAPVGMAIDNDEKRIFVSDTKLSQIKIFGLDGSMIGEFGKRGDNQGEFYYPLGICINSGDTVYVVDSFHFAVQALTENGDYIFSFGPTKTGPGEMARPREIAFDSEENLYITDALNNNVQIYDKGGNFLLKFGGTGLGPGKFRLPAGIHIANNNYIYIADSINNRIEVFKIVAR